MRFRRRLLDGAGAFPPEDCEGIWGYLECLAVVGKIKPSQDMHKDEVVERKEWLGDWDPDGFDLAEVKEEFDG